MANLDLGPNDYRKQDPRTGRWRVPNNPALARNCLFVAIAVLVFIYVTRDAGSRETLFGVTAMFSFFGGILAAEWARGRY